MSASGGTSERSAEHAHLAYVDGIRALAALYVVLTHALLIAAPAHRVGRTEGLRPSWLMPGHYAVAVFIVVSGFCLALPIVHNGGRLRGGARQFYRRRARRILPPYYAALLLTLVLVWTLVGADTGTFWDFSVPISVAGYVGNLLLVQDLVGFWQVNVPFWSIAVECQIYLVFPLLVLCWRRFGAWRTVVTTIWLGYVGVIATYAAGLIGPFYFPGLTLHFIGLFSLGMAGAWAAFSDHPRWIGLRERVPWGTLAALFAAIALGLFYAAGGLADAVMPFFELPVGLFATCVLVGGARPSAGLLRAFLGFRPLAFLGTFSYSLYLVHAPVLQTEWQYMLRPLGLGSGPTFALLVLVGVPVVLAATYLFFLVFEKPFVSPRQRLAAAGEVADAPRSGLALARPADQRAGAGER